MTEGGHSSLTLLSKTKDEAKISLHAISDGSNYYYYSNVDVYNFVHDILARLGTLK